ncbi:MAG: ABC transporter substrate-binding protein, partial [Halobacteria archaeon]|nr:ABC transporter substrate-binding protein [Halobacteria archaeon]
MKFEKDYSRRDFVKTVGATGVAGTMGLAGCMDGNGTGNNPSGGGSTGKQTLKVGVMAPMSGFLKYWGYMLVRGFMSGISYKYDMTPPSDPKPGDTVTIETPNTVYELYTRDTQYDPAMGQDAAISLYQEEGVDMLYGLINSSGAIRVIQNVVKQVQIPYMMGYPSTTTLTSDSSNCDPYVFRASEHNTMEARALGRYILEQDEFQNVFLMYPDSTFGSD